jgi:hypothetical protein
MFNTLSGAGMIYLVYDRPSRNTGSKTHFSMMIVSSFRHSHIPRLIHSFGSFQGCSHFPPLPTNPAQLSKGKSKVGGQARAGGKHSVLLRGGMHF